MKNLMIKNILLVSTLALASITTAQADIASWYGPGFHGKLTANGERFNMHAMTAAHKKYTFGTKLEVTNKRNGRSVVVCINDRGPYAHNRTIDLSQAAAKNIGMLGKGIAHVNIKVLSQPKSWKYGRKVC